jgi:protein-arginine kinase activator protein McsA
MAAKKKLKKFSVVKAVKSASREHVGTVPPTRAVPDEKERAKRREGKHKKRMTDLIAEEE